MTEPLTRISPNPPARRAGVEVRQIVDCIRELVAVGDVLTYAMVKDLCGINLQARRHLVGSIKRLAQDEYDIVLRVIPGMGYERLSEPEKVQYGDDRLHRVHRETKRIHAIQATVDLTALSSLETHRYLSQQTLVGCLQLWTDPRVRRALPQAPETPALPVPFDVEAHKDLFTRRPKDARKQGIRS